VSSSHFNKIVPLSTRNEDGSSCLGSHAWKPSSVDCGPCWWAARAQRMKRRLLHGVRPLWRKDNEEPQINLPKISGRNCLVEKLHQLGARSMTTIIQVIRRFKLTCGNCSLNGRSITRPRDQDLHHVFRSALQTLPPLPMRWLPQGGERDLI
jgi:hypothetical protein